ncbi:phage baseplate assembly protein V [Cellulomonas xiejunii]|uniref:Phage baseplate assembly protein V n=1 Tax=Cellulomonas xiejunii TaxID=2968083 RepID=A0ABY5KN94_9CELL|nr:phage baseplate assembly protein V [Cellulomonas xiejunii]MCC2315947.1 phage baseplate assembly protein V [Cellulomonas xiejunii]MCC2320964.1 phage baseplate assembly protein V [Cellulomonas xiejunii]UUI71244.1 phage baseplate assembly protein V [Cellulomonas xiejunii]
MTTDVGTARLNPLAHTSFDVRLGGRPLGVTELDDLVDVRVQRGVRTVGRASLTFVDRGYRLVTSRLAIGQDVEVRVDGTSLFTGTVTALGTRADHRGSTTTVTAHDGAYALTTDAGVVARANVDASQVVAELARAARLSVQGWPTSRTEPWHLQADSPLGLIDELAVASGLDWVVDGTTLRVWERASGTAKGARRTRLTVGLDLDELSARQVGRPDATYVVQGWDAATTTAVRATANAPAPRAGFTARVDADGATPQIQVGGLQVRSAEEARVRAEALAARHGRVEAQGRGPLAPDVVPGGEVEVAEGGPLDGTYYVQEVEHRFDGRASRTSFVAGDREPVRLGTAAPGERTASSAHHSGLVVATVNSTDDPDRLGRVRVTYVTASDRTSSDWARVLAPGGGSAGGMVLQHEPGDEVLVAFEGGDVSRPVVLGGLHSASAPPPQTIRADGGPRVRSMHSRHGQRLVLGDGESGDDAYVELALGAAGHGLRISQQKAVLEVGQIPLRIVAGSSSIELDGKGRVTVRGTDIAVQADNELRLKGTTVKIEGTAKVEVTGAQVALKANGTAEVSASGPTKIVGNPVAIN